MEAVEKPAEALKNLEVYWGKIKQTEPEVFAVGDHVRVKKKKGAFRKGHRAEFSSHVYRIKEVIKPTDDFTSHKYVIDGIPQRIFTYNKLIKTSDVLTQKKVAKPRDRLQKQAEKELQELPPVQVQPARTRAAAAKSGARKPRGTEVYIDVPARKIQKSRK